MQIRENVTTLSKFGPILPILTSLEVSSFTYKRIVDREYQPQRINEKTGQIIPEQPETYLPYPEGIQVMIEPTSLELMYPEGVVTSLDGTKHYRADLVTAFLVQAVKEVYNELSARIKTLESK